MMKMYKMLAVVFFVVASLSMPTHDEAVNTNEAPHRRAEFAVWDGRPVAIIPVVGEGFNMVSDDPAILKRMQDPENQNNYMKYGKYTDKKNGTILDNSTGLIWQQEDSGTMLSWLDAETYCSGGVLKRALTLAGKTDWRLPTTGELMSLVDTHRIPFIDLKFFPHAQSAPYWSSKIKESDPNFAYYVSFGDGSVPIEETYKTAHYFVRCVRE
jgi:hypothetical protein